MQNDWHRYNLKRRVASLPPLTSEIFAEKVLANKASAAATAARASFEKSCAACQKIYYSENAYQNHLGSQKHKVQVIKRENAYAAGADNDAESVMSSTFSLGEPIETASSSGAVDPEADAEFSKVVDGIKETSISDPEPVSRRPTRPHHSALDDRPEHPLSPSTIEDEKTTPGSEPSTTENVDLTKCLFCNFDSPNEVLNMNHMQKQHGLFIPESDYLADLDGLLGYLREKIMIGHQCLYCQQIKHTASGIQTHMRDRGHCMIAFSTEEDMLEIGEYYDFRSTYSDDEETDDGSTEGDDDTQRGGVRLGASRTARTTAKTADGEKEVVDGEEDGWESDSTLSSVPTDEITAVPIQDRTHRYKVLDKHRHHSHTDPRPHLNSDGFHSHAHSMPHAVYHDDYELHLPSGRTAGHRSLSKYYRQNLRNYPSPAELLQRRAIEDADSDADSDTETNEQQQQLQRVGGHDRGRQALSRANGGLGMIGVSEAKKREIRAVEKREKKREQRAQARYQWGNEKRANHQKHYRDPLLQ
ncbi:hypothetical protein B0A49_08680 [Cryomyces minteri]|uniref:C2H2-type domain-containing protein n=1 Tax=Cryomyces minteri TaxID=331657 RepID=A0A4U0WSF6_9PEZI|nr:hypothetical protein B0A49_08680 [Cryomyces minteri]